MAEGKTTLLVEADASQLSAEIASATRSVDGLKQSAATAGRSIDSSLAAAARSTQSASSRAQASNDRWMRSLEKLAATYGKPKSAAIEWQAAQRGLSDQAAPFIAALKRTETATGGVGKSARETAFAMRMLPAQFTDIATQLGSGQNPFQILLQQGGQIKDMFGGIGPALRAMGGYIGTLLLNPIVLSAAAIGSLGLAFRLGATELDKFQQNALMTGNALGVSANQARAMAQQMSAMGDITEHTAVKALTLAAVSGKIAGSQIEAVGLVAARSADLLGTKTKDTIDMFAQLAEKPADAAAKLNDKYNFLTLAVYNQITALEQQGRTDDAVALAQKTLADAQTKRLNEVQNSLGWIETAWRDVGKAAAWAWDQMLKIGRQTTPQDIVKQSQTAIDGFTATLQKYGLDSNSTAQDVAAKKLVGLPRDLAMQAIAGVKRAQQQLEDAQRSVRQDASVSAQQAAAAALERQKIDAQKQWDAQGKSIRSREQQRQDEIKQAKRDAETLGLTQEQLAQRIAGINAKYADKSGTKSVTQSAAERMLDSLRQQGASMQAQLVTSGKMTTAEQDLVKFNQQIADIKTKSVLTADQKSLLASQDAIRAQLEKNVAVAKELQAKQELAKLDERAAQIQQQIASANQNRAQQYQDQLSTVGLGQQAQERARSQETIRREFQKYQDRLTKGLSEGALSSPEFAKQSALISAQMQTALQAQQDYYAKLDTLNSDWRNGFTGALQDYQDQVKNVAASAHSAFSDAFKGMEDALVSFVSTGKASFSDLATSIVADIARMTIRQNVTGPLFSGLAGMFGLGATQVPFTGSMAASATRAGILSAFGISGARATGGPVAGGSSYLVGERGMEVFTPNVSGMITPNRALAGGDVTVNVINQSSQPVTASRPQISRNAAGGMVLDVMIKDLRTNGPYARQLRSVLA